MVKNLNLLDGGRHSDLYEALKRINATIEAELPPVDPSMDGPLVLRLHEVTATQQAIVGPKMWNLARVHAEFDLPVPPRFVVTVAAYAGFMTAIDLRGRLVRLGDLAASADAAAPGEACAEVAATIIGAALPDEIESQVLTAFDELGDPTMLVAVRSSTLGEDEAVSHAGQYESLLGVSRERLMDAYKRVVASIGTRDAAQGCRVRHSAIPRRSGKPRLRSAVIPHAARCRALRP